MSKILSIAWYKVLPAKFGGQKGIALFTKHLAEFHRVVLLCSKNNQASHELFEVRAELSVSKSQFLNPSCWRKIKRVAKELQPSFILIEHPYHGIAGRAASKKTAARLIVHSHNIESQRFKQLGKWWWKILAKYERWTHRQADLNLFKTQADHDWAVKNFGLAKEKCFVVPYGIERKPVVNRQHASTIIRQRHGLGQEKILLFAGTLDYEPNARAVELIYQQIAPGLEKNIPGHFKIIVCGRDERQQFQYLKQLKHAAVLYAGEVEDIENYFAAADVFLNPVATGGGIQTKILEALSYDLNVICFESMLDEQLNSMAASKIFTCEDGNMEEMINIIALVDTEADNWHHPTPVAFFEYYNWTNIVKRLNEKLEAIHD